MRVMVLAHGHPELVAGGAERAAYSLFQRLREDPDVEHAVFVARVEPQAVGHSALFGSFRSRADEIVATPPAVDGFTFQSLHLDVLRQMVDELVAFVRPTVVHIHHFIFWGVEIVDLFKRAGVRVVFTIHEYAAICANYGQMIKVDGRLCYAASPAECSMCFPAHSPGKFFVRNTVLRQLLDGVDAFVAPSRFLKQRFVAWGVAEARIVVIENMLDRLVLARRRELPPRLPRRADARTRIVFGFFGQINPFKGLDILLQAALMLPDEVKARVEIRIHGENRYYRTGEFGEKLAALLDQAGAVTRSMGAYRNEDVIGLMAACDWIVVPSVWWENSPIVIQESRMAGRPMICS
ncbi:MAG TPA: glycosyltransferase, partial [Beijerinckiaceae bacterium]|nr:glycosyltransferase [Beijerinckiaceae bacterium]